MIITYDDEQNRILLIKKEGKTYKIIGHCLRCGRCCKEAKCEHLIEETLDGKIWCSCGIQYQKPVNCALTIPEMEECGFKLIEVI